MKLVHKHICLSLTLSNSLCFKKNDGRPSRGTKWWAFMTHADTCRHECPVHPLNNCQGLCCEKRLRCCHLSPEPEMETGTAKQPAGCICCFSVTHTQSMNNPLSALLSTCCCSLHVFFAEHNRSALPSFCTF